MKKNVNLFLLLLILATLALFSVFSVYYSSRLRNSKGMPSRFGAKRKTVAPP
ncbi:hypothetical protein J4212_08560 [Candidatus Woesearchaeota archaeon]|nr:hypothetical protein [Candidatus Woesearchaeota archaeon]